MEAKTKSDEFESLTVEQMLEAVAKRLSSERESAKVSAEGKLSALNGEKLALLQELKEVNAKAAMLALSSVTAENLDEKVLIENHPGLIRPDYDTLDPKVVQRDGSPPRRIPSWHPCSSQKATIYFPSPERAIEIEKRLDDLSTEIGTEKAKAALDFDQEAATAKELDLVYFFRRMRQGSPKWKEPDGPQPPSRISKGTGPRSAPLSGCVVSKPESPTTGGKDAK